ncbi:hypothetical protein ACWFRF_15445 [Nocardia sp. NPDC055165]
MGLNITATRRMSLADFGQGWQDCYLLVRAANKALRDEWKSKFTPGMTNEQAEALVREGALQTIIGGVILNTNEDGSTELVTITSQDVPAVADALGFAWLNDAVALSSGADRLKAKTTF